MDKFPLFKLLDDLTKQGYIINTLIQIKSKKDVNIIVSTIDGKQEFTRGVIEANLYTRRELNAKNVRQRGKNILYLTNDGETIKIDVVSEEELAEKKEEIVAY